MARETRAAWARRVERWQHSGLTADRFAEREGVNARTLAFWKWRLKRDGAARPATGAAHRRAKRVAFVELVAPKPVAAAGEARSTSIEVLLPIGYRLRVAGGFERGVLTELLDVLEARR